MLKLFLVVTVLWVHNGDPMAMHTHFLYSGTEEQCNSQAATWPDPKVNSEIGYSATCDYEPFTATHTD